MLKVLMGAACVAVIAASGAYLNAQASEADRRDRVAERYKWVKICRDAERDDIQSTIAFCTVNDII